MRLVGDLGRSRVLAFQTCLKTVTAGRVCLLTLDTPPLAVVASPAALGMTSPLQPLPLLRRQSTEAHVHGIVMIVTAAG